MIPGQTQRIGIVCFIESVIADILRNLGRNLGFKRIVIVHFRKLKDVCFYKIQGDCICRCVVIKHAMILTQAKLMIGHVGHVLTF